MRLGAAASVALALGLGGCSADYVEGDAASVLLVIQDIANGGPLLSDVRGSAGQIKNCSAAVTLSAQAKNPRSTLGASEAVIVSGYQVSYRRSDGRGVQGLDVPYTISGSTTTRVTAGGGSSTDVTIDLVRHQAKLEPPLSNIVGVQVVTMFADVTIYGQTISQKAVTGQGSVQITFADFAEGTTTCEGS